MTFCSKRNWRGSCITAQRGNLPIIDYHCHVSLALMAEDHSFRSITEIWLDGDHYKWRAMRACGVPEHLISGDASHWEKFAAWAQTVPATLGSWPAWSRGALHSLRTAALGLSRWT
jgi:glucuronate isomerase